MCEPDLEPVAEQASRHTRFKEGRQVDRSYLVLGRDATPVGATQWSLREAMSGLEARDAPAEGRGTSAEGRENPDSRLAPDPSALDGLSEREFLLVLNAVDIVHKRTQSQAAALGWQQRTPAMAAGLADHIWSLEE